MSTTSLNHFDRIAEIYDVLARLVFGRSIVKAQTNYLPRIEENSKVLFLGGGSGWLVEELMKYCPSAQVWYIEASAKMISLTQKRNFPQMNITFIHGTEESIPEDLVFNTIITNFYLDLFPGIVQRKIIQRIASKLAPHGNWFVTDFVDEGKIWQRLLLKSMYIFFRFTSKIQANELADWRKQLQEIGFKKMESTAFFRGFIISAIYKHCTEEIVNLNNYRGSL